MLKNYILVAWRGILKNRLFSAINIIGLALSMSVCMIVLVRLMDSLSYDDFHPDEDRIFRIISDITNATGDHWNFASTPLPLAETLSRDSGTIESIAQLYPSLQDETTADLKEIEIYGAFASDSFFRLFFFPFRYGARESSLTQPYSIVLSEELAVKLFGRTNPVGKTVTLKKLGAFTVTGVIVKTSQKSHINFGAFVSMATVPLLENLDKLPAKSQNWSTFDQAYTYVKIKPSTANESLDNVLARISTEITTGSSGGSFNLRAQSLGQITPGESDMLHEISRGPTKGSLFAEAGIALIILVAAAFNYTNLSIARGLSRGKEVGIRKLAGAKRHQIFFQYIFESIILALCALLVANVIFGLILEYKPFNDGYEMVPAITPGLAVFSVFTCFAILAGAFSGAMPAWILSAFRPARILKNIGSEKVLGNLSSRKVLMVFQFALSLIVMIFLSAFHQQFKFLENSDPGFRSDNQFMISSSSKQEQLEQKLRQINGVEKIGFTSNAFDNRNASTLRGSLMRADDHPITFNSYACNSGYMEMAGLQFLEGHTFTGPSARDEIILNEKAVMALGYKNPADVLQQVLFFEDSVPRKVTGVIKDFYDNGYGNPVHPIALVNDPSAYRYIVVEAQESRLKSIPEVAKLAWMQVYPDDIFEFKWIDKEMSSTHEASASISLLAFLTIMTITIASMGLLGLVVYTTETRRKEMSIRKIVGARVDQIIALLSKGFINLLLISAMIAMPAGYVLSQWFLLNFTNRVSFGIPDLLVSFLVLLSVGLSIILPQTWKVSTENPSGNLRSE